MQTFLTETPIPSEPLINTPFPSQSGQITIPYFPGAKFLSISILPSLIFNNTAWDAFCFPIAEISLPFDVKIPDPSSVQVSSYLDSSPFFPFPPFFTLVPVFFVQPMNLWNLINNLFTRNAFPSPRMPAIIKKLLEDHGTAAARTIHRALTIHMNLLNRWINFI